MSKKVTSDGSLGYTRGTGFPSSYVTFPDVVTDVGIFFHRCESSEDCKETFTIIEGDDEHVPEGWHEIEAAGFVGYRCSKHEHW